MPECSLASAVAAVLLDAGFVSRQTGDRQQTRAGFVVDGPDGEALCAVHFECSLASYGAPLTAGIAANYQADLYLQALGGAGYDVRREGNRVLVLAPHPPPSPALGLQERPRGCYTD